MLHSTNSLAKFVLVAAVALSIQSCGLYTRSNEKEPLRKKESISGTFESEDLKTAGDNYSAAGITFDLPLVSNKLSKEYTYPLGLNFNSMNSRFGDVSARAHYLSSAETIGVKKGEPVYLMVESNQLLPIDWSIVYSKPVWKKLETIEMRRIDFGRKDDRHYYGTMPMECAIEVALRGGYEHSFHGHFFDGFIEDYKESHPTFSDYGLADIVYTAQVSELIRVGASFDRKIATRFTTTADGKQFSPKQHQHMGFYFDLLGNIRTTSTSREIVEVYVQNGQWVNNFDTISAADYYPLRRLGVALGFHYFNTGLKATNTLRCNVEVGLTPGYMQKWSSGIYLRTAVAIGLSWSKK